MKINHMNNNHMNNNHMNITNDAIKAGGHQNKLILNVLLQERERLCGKMTI